jgi:hypothetical protein
MDILIKKINNFITAQDDKNEQRRLASLRRAIRNINKPVMDYEFHPAVPEKDRDLQALDRHVRRGMQYRYDEALEDQQGESRNKYSTAASQRKFAQRLAEQGGVRPSEITQDYVDDIHRGLSRGKIVDRLEEMRGRLKGV